MSVFRGALPVLLLLLTVACTLRGGTETPAAWTPDVRMSQPLSADVATNVVLTPAVVEARTTPDDVGVAARELLSPDPTPGVRFTLSDADAPSALTGADRPTAAPSTPLSDEAVAVLLDRLPPLPETGAEPVAAAIKPGPRPPVITGVTIRRPFPPDEATTAPPTVLPEALEVLRYQPEGKVGLASHLAVTFSQPMVPLTSHADLAAEDVPVVLQPLPKGAWRWVGTRTLLFEPEPRFPMATEFEVTVPAGTRAETGAALSQTVRWLFRTPPPSVVRAYPSKGGPRPEEVTERQPVIFVALDQPVDPEAVLRHTTVKAHREEVEVRLATAAEIEGDPEVKRLSGEAEAGRWVALRPVAPLPLDAPVFVKLESGLPAIEGPLTTDKPQTFNFRVHGPLKYRGMQCEPGPGFRATKKLTRCPPSAPWGVKFNNRIDQDGYDAAAFSVSPDLPGQRVDILNGQVFVAGKSQARTTYTVTVPASLRDIYGQTLGEDVEVTFGVGDVRPDLWVGGRHMFVLDPYGPKELDVFSVNVPEVEVRLHRVSPEHWTIYDAYDLDDFPGKPLPGDEVWRDTVEPGGSLDEIVRTPVDLTPVLTDGVGQVLVVVKRSGKRPILRWVQVTELGVGVFSDYEQIHAWVTSLADGRAIQGAEVSLGPDGEVATSDAEGLAVIDRPAASATPESSSGWTPHDNPMMVARLGADVAFLPREYAYGWYDGPPSETLMWYVFEDRGVYQPGESVHLKGWVRRLDPGKHGDVAGLEGGAPTIAYVLTTNNGEKIDSGTLDVNAFGGFDVVLAMPEDIVVGAYVDFTAQGDDLPPQGRTFRRSIWVAEFRRPEYEVSATADRAAYMFGERAVVTGRATYYAGGALSGSEASWTVNARPADYSPPGHDDYFFGTRRSWWGWWYAPSHAWYGAYERHSGRTDGTGAHHLAIDFEGVTPTSPVAFNVEVSVHDINRQAWSGSTALMVHPARHYVGLRPDRWYAHEGESVTVEAVVVDIDGEIVNGGETTITAERVDWDKRTGDPPESPEPTRNCVAVVTDGPATCEFRFERGGDYRLTAEVVDPEGRRNTSQFTVRVWGDEPRPGTDPELDLVIEEARLVPDATSYQPGETAEILVQSPFAPAEGLLTVRRSGVAQTTRFRLTEPTTTVRVPIEEGHIPNITVGVDLVGASTREGTAHVDAADLPPRPAFAAGEIEIAVPPTARRLQVDVAPRDDEVVPGGETAVDITVRDANGDPLPGAEVALMVVDEAVLALTDYRLPDPVEFFHPERYSGVTARHSRAQVRLADPSVLAEPTPGLAPDLAVTATALWEQLQATPQAPPPATGGGGGPGEDPSERLDLDPLAAFEPNLRTDAEGRAAAQVSLPDNVTRYRITAAATDGDKRFGVGESTLTARLPLIVRPSLPRFLNYGDSFELPVVVQNQTAEDMDVDVVVRANNLMLGKHNGRRVTIPANDRVEVRFAAAAEAPGTAIVQVAAFGAEASDALRVSLPVWWPATTEAFATYGEIDDGVAVQSVARPPDVVEEFGGLDLTTSSTALSALTDSYLYLLEYPYGCSEQTASRLLATAAMADVLPALGVAELPSAEEVDAAIGRDVRYVQAHQRADGGFGWWTSSDYSNPFVSVHVAHALARARARGHTVDERMIERATDYLRDIRKHLSPYYTDLRTKQTVRAYALYVRHLLGNTDRSRARSLANESDDLSVEAMGWLLFVLTGDPESADEVDEIRRRLGNRASEEAGTAQFATSYREEQGVLILASDRRADAVVLEALIEDEPKNDLIPKLVRGLLGHRKAGRWATTQENAFVLLALERYFRAYEAEAPDFVARAWLGDGYLGESRFVGRSPDRSLVEVPLAALPPEGTEDVVLSKEGVGRLYYRLGLRYAPASLTLDPLDRGFQVERTYEAVDDPDDVRRTADGTWQVRAGARVRAKLTMIAPQRRYHVALVDPLPAGFEALNPDLAVTGNAPPEDVASSDDPYAGWWWSWRWYEHEAMRDERVEVFSAQVWPGAHQYSYVARATTPGEYHVPPAKAEEMYHPETFGRSGTEMVIVK